MNSEDAIAFLVAALRRRLGVFGHYGYELYLPNAMRAYIEERGQLHGDGLDREREIGRRSIELSPHFYEAAWDLCRRGILRPGIFRLDAQGTQEGSAGNGYSVTPFGRTWLAEHGRDDYVPTEPGRFAGMLAPHAERFGPSFQERAQEAIRCYGAHAYLACCAMCGAAAEAVLLAIAVAILGEEPALAQYNAQGGRGRLEARLTGKLPDQLKREFQGHISLLKYWRDSAAHGASANISDNEAYTSLALLLRFASFANDRWADLTRDGA